MRIENKARGIAEAGNASRMARRLCVFYLKKILMFGTDSLVPNTEFFHSLASTPVPER